MHDEHAVPFPRLRLLWAASRPDQVALVVLLYGLGVGMAAAGGPVVAAPPASAARAALPGLLALLPVTVAVHYANEYADADTDALTERTPFSGGSGALERVGLPRSVLGRAVVAAVAVSLAAVAAGLPTGRLPADAAALLLLALVLGLAYSLPPVALVRRGVGEPVNAVLGGLLLPVYGVAAVARPTPAAALAVLPFALLVGCNLLATHWPDREADAAVGKRTLAVRLAPAALRRLYAALALAAAVLVVVMWRAAILPDVVAAAHLLALPPLVWGGRTLTRRRSPLPAVLAMVTLAAVTTVAWWARALTG